MEKRTINPAEFPQNGLLRDKIVFLLQYAVIAPSTHNTQPWIFHIEEDRCEIHINRDRVLSEADPELKYLHISLGACLENLILAAKHYGIFGDLVTFPAGEADNHVATVTFSEKAEQTDHSSLLNAMLMRRNARGFFKDEPLSKEQTIEEIERLKAEGYGPNTKTDFITQKERIEKVAQATAEGLEKTYKNKEFRKEMSGWMHSSLTLKKEGMPGYALRVPFLFSFILPTLVRLKDIGAKLGRLNFNSIRTAPVVVTFSADNPSPDIWLEMGRLFERYVLEGVSKGIYPSVFVASIEAKTLPLEELGLTKNPEFLFVVGKPEYLAPLTPRFSVKEKIK